MFQFKLGGNLSSLVSSMKANLEGAKDSNCGRVAFVFTKTLDRLAAA